VIIEYLFQLCNLLTENSSRGR